MKKFIKGCIIAGLVCLLAGGGMMTTAVAMGASLTDAIPQQLRQWWNEVGDLAQDEFWTDSDFPFESEDQEQFNINEFPTDKNDIDMSEQGDQIYSGIGIVELDADLMVGKVRIIDDSVGDEITIYSNKDSSFYKIEDKGGELKLKTYPGNGYRQDSSILFTIHVPENHQFTKVKISISPTNNKPGKGSFKSVGVVAKAISADELSLNVTAGVANISQGNVGKLSIDSEAGAVNYSGDVLDRVSVDCEASAINLKLAGEKEDFSYKVDSELGAVKLGDESITVLGKTGLENANAPKSMDLKCEVSAVKITFMNQV
jgi:hypothetical protein